MSLTPVDRDGITATAITVELPKTTLIAVTTTEGYIMCGALDVALLNTRLAERRIIAGRAMGVKSVPDLLEAPLAEVTDEAQALGIRPGMKGREALRLMQ